MKKTISTIAVIMSFMMTTEAQFSKLYSANNHNIVVNDAVTVSDNSVYICGRDVNTREGLLVHIDQNGNLLWWNDYEAVTHFQRIIAAQDNSNDVLVITNSGPPTVGGVVSDFRWTVCRIDPGGNVLWINDYNCSNGATSDVERGYFIAPTTPNVDEYFIGGTFNTNGTLPDGNGFDDIMLIRIDGATGAVLALGRYNSDAGNHDEELITGVDDGTGGCVMAGGINSSTDWGTLAAFDNNCNIVTGGNFHLDLGTTSIWDIDRIGSDYLLLGSMYSLPTGDMHLMRTDAASGGAITWQIILGINADHTNARVSAVNNQVYVSYVDIGSGLSQVHVVDYSSGSSTYAFTDPDCDGTALIIPQWNSTDLYYINRTTSGTEVYVVSNSINNLCNQLRLYPVYENNSLAKSADDYTPLNPIYGLSQPSDQGVSYITRETSCAGCKYICNENNFDYGRSIITTQDDEVAVFGTMTDALPSVESDMYFAKLDHTLSTAGAGSAKKIGDISLNNLATETGYSIMQASDGFYYMIGTTIFSSGNSDVYVVKLNPGNYHIVWAKNYGQSNYNDYGIKLVERKDPNDPGLVVVGYRQLDGISQNPHRIFAFRIDFNGVYDGITDTHIYAAGTTALNDDFAWDAIALDNISDGIAIVGETNNGSDQSLLAFRISEANLNLIAANTYHIINDGPFVNEAGYGIVELDNNVYITGKTNSNIGNGAMDACIVRLPSAFTSTSVSDTYIYGRAFDNFADECGNSIIKTVDNNLIVAGYKHVYHPGQKTTRRDGLVFKVLVDTPMTIVWSKCMGSIPTTYQYNDELYDLVQLPDNSLALTGYKGISLTDPEFFLSRLSSDGEAGCCFLDYPMNAEKGSKSEAGFSELHTVDLKNGAYKHDEDYYCEVILCTEEGHHHRIGADDYQSGNNIIFDAGKKLVLYPNPSNGNFNLALTDQEDNIKSYTIIDLSGRILLTKNITDESKYSSMEIALPGFAHGIYFIEVQTSSDRIRTKLIIQ